MSSRAQLSTRYAAFSPNQAASDPRPAPKLCANRIGRACRKSDHFPDGLTESVAGCPKQPRFRRRNVSAFLLPDKQRFGTIPTCSSDMHASPPSISVISIQKRPTRFLVDQGLSTLIGVHIAVWITIRGRFFTAGWPCARLMPRHVSRNADEEVSSSRPAAACCSRIAARRRCNVTTFNVVAWSMG
jgi:hypothetical protein